ncbi:MAG: hypothetical protein V1721_09285 [Pseudomonadota bacterium]
MNEKNINFGSNRNDLVTLTAKGALGAVPVVGGALAEILGAIIPNQRLDRIAKYLEKLQSLFNEEAFERIKTLPEKVALIEEGIFAAGLTPQEDRLNRITHVIAYGLGKEDVEKDRISRILNATKHISDLDCIVLKYNGLFGKNFSESSAAFRFQEKHPEIWPKVRGGITDERPDRDEYAKSLKIVEERAEFVYSSELHLASLSLVKPYTQSIHSPYSNDMEGLAKSLESIMSSIKNEEFCITDLGLETLEAIASAYIT